MHLFGISICLLQSPFAYHVTFTEELECHHLKIDMCEVNHVIVYSWFRTQIWQVDSIRIGVIMLAMDF